MTSSNPGMDIETAHDVKLLVGQFYTRIREDAVLGPIFDQVAAVDWVDHIPTMCDFWETVLLQTPGYKGDPVLPHVKIHQKMKELKSVGLQREDFDRWLQLFYTAVDALYVGPRAEQAKRGANRMAEQIMVAIASEANPLKIASRESENGQAPGYHFT